MALAESFLNTLHTIGTVLLYTWWLFIILGLYIVKKRWEVWNVDAVILEKRSDNLVRTNDRLRKVEDKQADLVYYKSLKTKETMPVINFEWLITTNIKHTNILERIINFFRPTVGTAFLFRYGSRQYKPLNVKGNNGKLKLKEIKDREGNPLYHYVYIQFDPREPVGPIKFEVVDWDNMNFIAQEQRASTIRRAKRADFWKSLAIPALIIAGTVVIAIFILKFSADAGADLRGGAGGVKNDNGGVISGAINDALPTPKPGE